MSWSGKPRQGANGSVCRPRLRVAQGGALLLLSGALVLPAPPLSAACLPDPASPGDTVSCSGNNPAGYAVPTGVDSVTVVIEENATVTAPGDGIVVENTSAVTNHGQIDVTGSGSSGILGGDGTSSEAAPFVNSLGGSIVVSGPDAFGIHVGTRTRTENNGTIEAAGSGSTGIAVLNSSGVFNTGSLEVSGVNATGVSGATGVLLESTGSITVSGDQATGASLGSGSQIVHGGDLTLSGVGTTGLAGGRNTVIDNRPGAQIVLEATALDAVGLAGGDSAGQITNRGSIISSAPGSTGIRLGNNASVGGNLGTMVFNANDSIGLQGGQGTATVNEFGASLEMTGDNVIGIQIAGGGQAINAGTMTLNGPGARGGVGGDGSAGSPTRFNNDPGATLSVSGPEVLGADLGIFTEGGNSGSIEVLGTNAIAIRAGSDSLFFNRGEISIGGSGSHGIEIGAHSDPDQASFTNAAGVFGTPGGILRSTDPAAGALILMGEALPGGASRIENGAGASILADLSELGVPGRGIAIQGSPGDDVVLNAGLIQGTVLLAEGDDRFLLATGAELSALGNPVVDGGTGANTLELTGEPGALGQFDSGLAENFGSLRISSGRWQLTGQSPETRDVVVDRNGTLTLVAPTTIDGSYSHAPPTSLVPQPGDPEPTLQALLSAATQDGPLLTTTGSAALGDGLLEVIIGGGFRGQADFILLQADGGRINEFDRIVLPNNPDFVIGVPVYSANQISLSVNVTGYSDNQWATSQAITALSGPGASSDTQALVSQTEILDFESYLDAMDQLSPAAYGAHTQATLELGNRFVQTLLERPRFCIAPAGQVVTDPRTRTLCRERPLEPWITSYGQFSDYRGRPGQISYSDDAGGLALGVDGRVDENLVVSASLGTAYDSIHVDGAGPGDFKTLDLGLYAGYTAGNFRLQGVTSYGHSWQHRVRDFAIGDFVNRAEGDYGIDRLEIRAEAEYGIESGALLISPALSLDYTALLQSEIRESGGGGAALVLPSRTDSTGTARIGFDLTTALHKNGYWTDLLENVDGVWRPRFSLRWRQPLGEERSRIEAHFLDSTADAFSIESQNFQQGFEVGAGLDWTPLVADRLTFTLRYDGFLWKDTTVNAVTAQVRLSF